MSFLRRMGGHVATLMDYSRFNYVAQPEDSIPAELLIPGVGPYDRFAIRWQNTPITGARTPHDEWPTLDSWSRLQDTVPWSRFSTSDAPGDAGDITEAVGDADAVKSSTLALRNLERGVRFTTVSEARQKEAMQFLGSNAFRVPAYLLDRELLRRMEQEGVLNRIRNAQASVSTPAGRRAAQPPDRERGAGAPRREPLHPGGDAG